LTVHVFLTADKSSETHLVTSLYICNIHSTKRSLPKSGYLTETQNYFKSGTMKFKIMT